MKNITLLSIFKRYKWKMSLTFFFVFLESVLFVLFPLVIGFAINGMLEQSYTGIFQLVTLGVLLTIIGTIRRMYDTRVYAGIYKQLAFETTQKQKEKSTSAVSGKVTMLKELVEFFENSFPDLVNSIIGLVGTLIILFSLSENIFFACLGILVFIYVVFALSSKKTSLFNHNYNNTLEEQVDIVESKNPEKIKKFFHKMMHWNIKLSDIESINFAVVWLAMSGLIIFAIVESTSLGLVYGSIFSIIMYVFNFAESSTMLPMYYQEYLRLKEISKRL